MRQRAPCKARSAVERALGCAEVGGTVQRPSGKWARSLLAGGPSAWNTVDERASGKAGLDGNPTRNVLSWLAEQAITKRCRTREVKQNWSSHRMGASLAEPVGWRTSVNDTDGGWAADQDTRAKRARAHLANGCSTRWNDRPESTRVSAKTVGHSNRNGRA